MKFKILAVCISAIFLASCIQDEALNSEAAIDACTGKDVQLSSINADSKVISVYVHKGANLAQQKLSFVYPEGATLKINDPKPGDSETTYDFSTPPHSRFFTVTSEDGKWNSTYEVRVIPTELPSSFHFEGLLESPQYDIFYEFDPGTSQDISKVLQWSSGNPGFELTKMANSKEDYPTLQTPNGYKGKAAKLVTRSTGSFGAMVKMYIAAGNLFIGSFNLGNALTNAPKATTFGFQYYKRPVALKGYYKYKSGDIYTEGGVPQNGKKDKCDIYAIMYEANDNSFMLDGSNALTSDKLVSLARIEPSSIVENDAWTEFNLPFNAVGGKTIDDQKLKDGKYKLAIVFSSSVDGAFFKGAVGSTLYIDEVEIISRD